MTLTEKLDGTCACICITDEGKMFFASRNRWLTPGKGTDNYGFAAWGEEHKEELLKLGQGRHYGEWFGYGIGPRGYGLPTKRLALFNTFRPKESLPPCVENVTILYQGSGMELSRITAECIEKLNTGGSVHVPGYMKPEGLVVYSSLTKSRYKVLCENDDRAKGQPSAEE